MKRVIMPNAELTADDLTASGGSFEDLTGAAVGAVLGPPRVRFGGRALRIASAYAQLTKPRIVLLLLITTVPAMILADRGVPSLWLIAATLIGGTAAAGGANAINQYIDRDIDDVMRRTRRRPLPSKRIEPRGALVFGLVLGAAGFVWLTALVNLLAAVLALGALAFYVLVYTLWLKRSTAQNIVIGGAAGAAPALVGWAAVTGRVGLPAVVLFAVVFIWTPPHFWALALRYERDYAAAGVPMLPVVAGREATERQILGYSIVLVAASLVLVPVAHSTWVYPVAASVLGLLFVQRAWRLRHEGTAKAAMELFRFSIVYLALLFASVAVDTLVRYGA
jgi:protoheme IX farnesyltransferase